MIFTSILEVAIIDMEFMGTMIAREIREFSGNLGKLLSLE